MRARSAAPWALATVGTLLLASCRGEVPGGDVTAPTPTDLRPIVDADSLFMQQGENESLGVQVLDPNDAVVTGRSVSWSSSAQSIATVDQQGLVTALSAGLAEIIAAIDDGRDTVVVSVTDFPTEVIAVSVEIGVPQGATDAVAEVHTAVGSGALTDSIRTPTESVLPTVAIAVDDSGAPVFLSLVEDGTVTLGPESTAAGLVELFLPPGLVAVDPDEDVGVAARQVAGFADLSQAILDASGSSGGFAASDDVGEALATVVQQVLAQIPAPAATDPSSARVTYGGTCIGAPIFPESQAGFPVAVHDVPPSTVDFPSDETDICIRNESAVHWSYRIEAEVSDLWTTVDFGIANPREFSLGQLIRGVPPTNTLAEGVNGGLRVGFSQDDETRSFHLLRLGGGVLSIVGQSLGLPLNSDFSGCILHAAGPTLLSEGLPNAPSDGGGAFVNALLSWMGSNLTTVIGCLGVRAEITPLGLLRGLLTAFNLVERVLGAGQTAFVFADAWTYWDSPGSQVFICQSGTMLREGTCGSISVVVTATGEDPPSSFDVLLDEVTASDAYSAERLVITGESEAFEHVPLGDYLVTLSVPEACEELGVDGPERAVTLNAESLDASVSFNLGCGPDVDSDGDGIGDARDCDPAVVNAGSNAGILYMVCQGQKDFFEAESACADIGFGVAHIDDEAENTWVVDLAIDAYGLDPWPSRRTTYWIANLKTDPPQTVWPSGSPVWATGEPNSVSDTHVHLIRYWNEPYGWNDAAPGSWRWGWVCEG